MKTINRHIVSHVCQFIDRQNDFVVQRNDFCEHLHVKLVERSEERKLKRNLILYSSYY